MPFRWISDCFFFFPSVDFVCDMLLTLTNTFLILISNKHSKTIFSKTPRITLSQRDFLSFSAWNMLNYNICKVSIDLKPQAVLIQVYIYNVKAEEASNHLVMLSLFQACAGFQQTVRGALPSQDLSKIKMMYETARACQTLFLSSAHPIRVHPPSQRTGEKQKTTLFLLSIKWAPLPPPPPPVTISSL